MAGFDDLPAEVRALQSDVQGALIGTVLGTTQPANDSRTPLIAQTALIAVHTNTQRAHPWKFYAKAQSGSARGFLERGQT